MGGAVRIEVRLVLEADGESAAAVDVGGSGAGAGERLVPGRIFGGGGQGGDGIERKEGRGRRNVLRAVVLATSAVKSTRAERRYILPVGKNVSLGFWDWL